MKEACGVRQTARSGICDTVTDATKKKRERESEANR